MTAWTHQEIRRLSNQILRQLSNGPDSVVLLDSSKIPAFKVKHYETLTGFLDTVPYCMRVAADENPKTKVDLLLFGCADTALKLWSRVKMWAHVIITEACAETEDFKDDEDADLIKEANDAVIEKTKTIRRLAKQRIASCYGVDLNPKRRYRS